MQSLESLSRLVADSPHLRIEEMAPGYPVVQVAHPHATAAIALHGAHLISWQPVDTQPVIYTSPEAIFREGKAIRGGIPICWPWFNAHPVDPSKPSHGFARDRFWEFKDFKENEDGVELLFEFRPIPESIRALFPYEFELTYTVRVGSKLEVCLRTRNLHSKTFTIGGALHTYFALGDLSETAISGLDGVDYLDCVGERVERKQNGPIHFGGEVDRIYHAAPPVDLVDRSWNRRISLTSEGSNSTVVWNPFFAKAEALGDLPGDGYRDFVCIETANAGKDLIELAPEEAHTLRAIIEL